MRRVLALGLVALAALPSAAVADVTDGSFALVDRPTGFGALPFDGVSASSTTAHAISANGCYVVFTSNNDNLLPDDDDAFTNIYRKDRCIPGHPVALVSAASDGTPGNGESRSPSISADGRYVAFVTEARNLDPAVLGGSGNTVLVKDMGTHAIEVANRADGQSGAVAPQAFNPVISGDGRHVAFPVFGAFHAANVDGVANGFDAYVRFLDTKKTYMASVTSANAHDGAVFTNIEPGISFDGSSVAFVSGHNQSDEDAHLVRDYTGSSPSNQLVSYEVGNEPGSDSATRVALSSDGKRVAWSNDRVWFTVCDPNCAPDAPADGAPSGGSTTFTALSFAPENDATTPPGHLFWTNDRSLKPEDTNQEQDM